jgi:coproporphyrinogen III oxidase
MIEDATGIARLQMEAPLWFAALRDRICAALEALEQEASGPFHAEATGPGVRAPTPGSARITTAGPAAAASCP